MDRQLKNSLMAKLSYCSEKLNLCFFEFKWSEFCNSGICHYIGQKQQSLDDKYKYLLPICECSVFGKLYYFIACAIYETF